MTNKRTARERAREIAIPVAATILDDPDELAAEQRITKAILQAQREAVREVADKIYRLNDDTELMEVFDAWLRAHDQERNDGGNDE